MSLKKAKITEFDELKTFMARTKKSLQIYQRASKVIPMGVNSSWRFPPYMVYPLYMAKAKGSRIWDADGNEYIDYQMGYGAVMVGHRHPLLVEALKEALDNGAIIYGTDPADIYEVAEELTRRFKMDMVRMSCSGSEATLLALKLARAYTNRDKIVKFEGCYHGGTNEYLYLSHLPAIAPASPVKVYHSFGVPRYVWKDTLVARFNDLDSVECIFNKYGDEIAGVIVEPVAMNMGVIPPEKGFLEGLRKICDEYGSLLIFDEVKTCVRLAYGGAVEYFGVQPDIITVAKPIAGGLPFSATLGKEEVMKLIGSGKVSHSGSYNANPLCVTAAKVVLKKILTPDVYESARRLSEELAKGYQDIIEDVGMKAVVQWIGVNGHIFTGITEPVKNYKDYCKQDNNMWWCLAHAMMNMGVIFELLSGCDEWTVSIQHTKEDIETTLEVFKEVASKIT